MMCVAGCGYDIRDMGVNRPLDTETDLASMERGFLEHWSDLDAGLIRDACPHAAVLLQDPPPEEVLQIAGLELLAG